MNKSGRAPVFWLVMAFTAIYIVWGTTYVASLFALGSFKPFVISALRYLVAGLMLAIFAALKRQSLPGRREVISLSVSGILMLVGGSGLVVVAEQYITSGSAAVIVATEPFWFILLDRPRWKLYLGNRRIIGGLLLGFTGIVLFACFSPRSSGALIPGKEALGILIVVVSCILWVAGTLFSARQVKEKSYSLWHVTTQLMAAGIFSALIASLKGEWSLSDFDGAGIQAWGGLAFLIVFGSLVAYLAFSWLVTVQPPAIVSTHTLVNPVIAVFTGWLLAGEKVHLYQLLSLLLVLAGVAITQMSKSHLK